MMGGSYTPYLKDLDVPEATFACPDLTTFCRLDELGLEVTGQRLRSDRAVLGSSTRIDGVDVAASRARYAIP